jgi:DNA invertase Pin-like site-specific DNA recombinase
MDYETEPETDMNINNLSSAAPSDTFPKPPRYIGYARVSTQDQNTALQHDALILAGCHAIYEDRISGMSRSRDGLDAALADITAGDRLVVWRLDRLGRSLRHVMTVIEELTERGAGVVSICENLDTGTEAGQIYSTILAMIAHVERRMIVSRTRAGLQSARERGVRLGAPRKMTQAQITEARDLLRGGMKAEAVAARYGVGRSTLFRGFDRKAA